MMRNYTDGAFYNADCFDVLPILPDGCVDMIVTSPPYDNLREYNGMKPFTMEVFKPIARELSRVLKEGGVIVWNVADATVNGSETGTSFRQALYFKDECELNIHDTMIWTKDGGGAVGSNKSYTQNFEYMFVLSKGKIRTTNLLYDVPNGSFGKNKSGVGRRTAAGDHKIEERKPCAEFKRRNNWWYIAPERGEHPAVFPIAIPTDHILSWSNPNDIVLDPFAGSGTTAVAARNTGRRWICIERDAGYFEAANARLVTA